ncbi:biotin/lipoyl-binding protein [bacterium]|nr:biotin/lipoyl-binding protein [bacterium]
MNPALPVLRRTRSNRWLCAIITISLLVISGTMGWLFAREWWNRSSPGDNPPAATAPVRKIHALGRLEPRGRVLRIAPPSGNEGAIVQTLLVAEGDDVEPGQVLAVLDVAERRQAAVQEAESRWHAAEARLAQVRAGAKPGDIAAQVAMVTRTEAQLSIAKKELERARQLAEQNVLPAESLDVKELAYEQAELEAQRSRAMLDSLKEVREVDVRVQEQEVATAFAALQHAKADRLAAEVHSPAVGRVLKIHTRAGERVGDNGLLELGDVQHMQAVAEVFEGDVHDLQPGQPATIEVQSTRRRYQGEVAEIGLLVARKVVLSNDPVSDTDARVIEVRIDLRAEDIPDLQRLSNARIEVSIEISPPAVAPSPHLAMRPREKVVAGILVGASAQRSR